MLMLLFEGCLVLFLCGYYFILSKKDLKLELPKSSHVS